MKLKEWLNGFDYNCIQGDVDTEVSTLVYDSRKVEKGSVFVCVNGAASDGHDFAQEVVKKGAVALITQKDVDTESDVTIIRTKDTRLALACMSAAYFDHPAGKLTTIGITGTKGKTTVTYMVRAILEKAKIKTGLIGTIETIIGKKTVPSTNTTPESYVVQETLKQMVDAGCQCVVMEVSSQGLMLKRVAGFVFDYGIFTNLEPDHIGPNEHKDLDDYISCKSMLFRQCRQGIFNADDSYLPRILAGHTCTVETFGFSADADLFASDVRLLEENGKLGVAYRANGLCQLDVTVDIPGKFSVCNSLAAIAVCRHFDVKEKEILSALADVRVKGRVELLPISSHFTLMIDYAHNAMSLNSLLTTLLLYHPKRLVCVFGCGGNRAKDRRFQMGEVSSTLADFTIVTSDNPRNEDPEQIIADIVVGVQKGGGEYITITDRKSAIRYAIENAKAGDVIVLAGKGHEDYQEIKGKKYPMDERKIVADVGKDGNFLR